METIFMNTENSKASQPHRYKFYFTDKLDLRNNKTISLVSLSIYYTWQNIKPRFKNDHFKITAPTWDETFDLPDGSYTLPNIQDYFLYIVKQHESDVTSSEQSPTLVYPNYIKNRTIFKIKTGCKKHMLTNEAIDLLGDGPIADEDKNSKNVPKLEQVTSVLVHLNLVQNDSTRYSKLLYSCVPNNIFGQLLYIQPTIFIKSKSASVTFDYIEIWFTDQKYRPLKNEDDVDITLVIQ